MRSLCTWHACAGQRAWFPALATILAIDLGEDRPARAVGHVHGLISRCPDLVVPSPIPWLLACVGCWVIRLPVGPKPSGHAPMAQATAGSRAGHCSPQNVSLGMGAMPSGHSRGPTFPQAAPRVSMANIATRSVTVTTRAAATASTEPASVIQGSTAACATWVSPTARWLPGAEGLSTDTVPSGPQSSLGLFTIGR